MRFRSPSVFVTRVVESLWLSGLLQLLGTTVVQLLRTAVVQQLLCTTVVQLLRTAVVLQLLCRLLRRAAQLPAALLRVLHRVALLLAPKAVPSGDQARPGCRRANSWGALEQPRSIAAGARHAGDTGRVNSARA